MTEGMNMILTLILLTLFVYALFSPHTHQSDVVVVRQPRFGYRGRRRPWGRGFRRRRYWHA